METLGFKLFKDPALTYELSAGDAQLSLNSINNQEQTITIYLGAWDGYDAATHTYTRKRITFQGNDTLLWTIVRFVDDGQGGTIPIPAVDLVKEVRVIAPDEDNVIALEPNTPVANFYYNSEVDKNITSANDNILWGMFGVGEHKFGWSTATNEEAGGFRLAKRDPNDPSIEIIMTREMRYGSGVAYEDRFTTYQHGESLPTDGWYVKDFWAYTYPNDNNDDLQENDIIARLITLQSGVPNKLQIDITFALPQGASGAGVDFAYKIAMQPIVDVLYEEYQI